ncbi:glycine dehydrogenase [Ceraceosorus bombacis]|uniref:Glycine cleavage system H protein n=1 Tax=Ceraceosorus bombacis TaxID=401625 RepID=A0A0N7LBG5_9BASI|nr:glycine dehydrogenase [Ceraceosorus bombacis]
MISLLPATRQALRTSSSSSAIRRPLLSPAALPAACLSRSLQTTVRAEAISKRFTAEHEWVSFDDATNIGKVGITDYAQKSLGDVVYVELPSEGSTVDMGEQIGAVESVKAASDIYSPVSGVIESVNDQLGNEPGLLNKSPEDKGWLCAIKLATPNEFETLLDEKAYKALCEDS